IRPGGDYRISNFLLWQLAYTEFWITPVLWPDFHREHFIVGLKRSSSITFTLAAYRIPTC
ncbi:undecaprenyl diphosphate synthase family protein, partial [Desulforudis sp. 1190]|uniref:undecaprenyl diphosphate synthase family protein n=1 Tax=Desulforudis sp. 1190 TaxID=3416136 RepID=UPI003CF50BBF